MDVHLLNTSVVNEDALKTFFGKCKLSSLEELLVGQQEEDSIIVGKFLSTKTDPTKGYSNLTLLVNTILPKEDKKSLKVLLFDGFLKEFEKCLRYAKIPGSWIVFSEFNVAASDIRNPNFHCLELRSVRNKSQISILFQEVQTNNVPYENLMELSDKKSCNVFCIINKAIKGLCYISNKNTRHAMYSITDQNFYEQRVLAESNMASIDMPIHIFLNSPKDQIPTNKLEENDIVRIMGLTGDLYDNKLFGIINSPYQITVFRKDKNGNILPKTDDPNYIYSESDQREVNKLRKWWVDSNLNQNDPINMNIEEVSSGTLFSLVCQVVDVKAFLDKNFTVVRITDGTPTKFETKKYDLSSNTAENSVAPIGMMTVDICVFNPCDIAAGIEKNMFLHMMFVTCREWQINNQTPFAIFEMIHNYSQIIFLDEYLLRIFVIKQQLKHRNSMQSVMLQTDNNIDAGCSNSASKKQSVTLMEKDKRSCHLPIAEENSNANSGIAHVKYNIECSNEVDSNMKEFLSDTSLMVATMTVILAGSYARESNPCSRCLSGTMCLHDWVHGICQYCMKKESPSELRKRFSKEELSTQKLLKCPNNCSLSAEFSDNKGSVKPIFVLSMFFKDEEESTTVQAELYGKYAIKFWGMEPSFSWLVNSASVDILNRVSTIVQLEETKKTFCVCLHRNNNVSSNISVANTKLMPMKL